jgi:DNA-binding NtrC family response regulator
MSIFLIVDHDAELREDICAFFRTIGHSLFEASDLEGARARLSERVYDVIITSAAITGGTVQDLITAAKRLHRDTAVIVCTEIQTIQQGVTAVQSGAFAIVQKPFSIPELSFQVKRALDARERTQTTVPERTGGESYQPYNFIGESPQIQKVFRIVTRVAKTDHGVLILGETGTGKELVAGAIHYNSHRADGRFVRVNCAALPEQLLESELFGHEKGAFTGADRRRAGRFEHANGGTIFLDEVADMSPATQAKLLRVIQEKEFEMLGSNHTIKTDVRILAATNRNLVQRMREGLFREDLYYRLNVISVVLPPLRERGKDIELLVRFFLAKASAEIGRKPLRLTADALRTLTGYHWPGNIRELENTIQRAVLLSEGGVISRDDLSLVFPGDGPAEDPQGLLLPAGGIRLGDAERALIVQALERCGWSQKEAARLLGVSSRALNYRIKRFGIRHAGWRQNS